MTTSSGTSATGASDQFTYNAAPTVTTVNPTSGPQAGGTSVTVTGTGFVTGATTVDFGSTAGTTVDVTSSDQPHGQLTGGDRHGQRHRVDHQWWGVHAADQRLHLQRPADGHRINPTSGPQAGGTSVTVTGTGFVTGSTTVEFGSTAGTSVDVTSPTNLTVDSPAGTGMVSVTVITTAGGASTPLANAYTYTGPPTVTAVNPTNGPQTGGTSVTVTGTGFVTGATTVDFGSTAGTSVDVTSGTSLTVNSPAGTGTVDVTVTTSSGTSATGASDKFTYNAAPTVTAVNPTSGPQAGGTSVTVTGTGFVTGSTTVDFGSTAGTSVDVTSATNLTVNSPSGTGTVDVTVDHLRRHLGRLAE